MNWYKQAQISIPSFVDKWQKKGITLYVTEGTDYIRVDSIIVPKEIRNQGIGTEIMNEIINYADSVRKPVRLSPGEKDPYHGTTSKSRLINFYRRFGFIPNKGRNKDYRIRDTMYRNPNELV
jgi:GNAT superfamily N-acetyltransferase